MGCFLKRTAGHGAKEVRKTRLLYSLAALEQGLQPRGQCQEVHYLSPAPQDLPSISSSACHCGWTHGQCYTGNGLLWSLHKKEARAKIRTPARIQSEAGPQL